MKGAFMLSWGDINSSRSPLLPAKLRRSRRSTAVAGSIQLPPATVSYSGSRAHLDAAAPTATRTSTSMGRAGLVMTTAYGTGDPSPSAATSPTGNLEAKVLRRRPVSFQTVIEGYSPAPAQATG